MTLNRLASTTLSHPPESIERAHRIVGDAVRRVEATDGTAADRERSLHQEMAEVEPNAVGPFKGGERILQDARRVASQLILLGTNTEGLRKLRALSVPCRRIDDKA